MKRRKLLASILALTLSFGLSVPALAAGDVQLNETTNSTTITVNTTLNVPTIDVVIAPLADMVINPYQLTVDSKNDSLITVPALITNNSEIKIDLTAKPFVSDAKGVVITATKAEAESTTAKAAAYMEFAFADTMTSNDVTAATFNGSSYALKEGTGDGITTPPKTTLTAATKSGSTVTPTYSAYRISGVTTGKGWTSENKFTVQIIFDIAPVIGA